MNYPYIASNDRATLIKNEYTKVRPGDTKSNVIKILNEPDEIHDLYEPKKYKPNIIGKTYWYVIQRTTKIGSVNEKNEILVRVSFDLNEIVVKVDHWGF